MSRARLVSYLISAGLVTAAVAVVVGVAFSWAKDYPDYSVSGSVRVTGGHDPEVLRLTDGEGGLAQVAIVKARWEAEAAIEDSGGYLLAVEQLPRRANGSGWNEHAADGPHVSLAWNEAGEQAEAKLQVDLMPIGASVRAPRAGEAALVLTARKKVPQPEEWRVWLIQLDQRDNADDLVAVKQVDVST